MLVDAGFTKSQLYTADGPEEVPTHLSRTASGHQLRPRRSAEAAFATLKKPPARWPLHRTANTGTAGSITGAAKHASTDAQQQAADLDWILAPGLLHQPLHVPRRHQLRLDEWRQLRRQELRARCHQLRLRRRRSTRAAAPRRNTSSSATLLRRPPEHATALATIDPAIAVPSFTLTQSASLWDNLPKPVRSDQPLTMEDLDQAYGYILYRTTLTGPVQRRSRARSAPRLRQRSIIDGKLQRTLDRRLKSKPLPLNITGQSASRHPRREHRPHQLHARSFADERKGITKQVTLAGKPVTGWDIYPLPMLSPQSLTYSKRPPAMAPASTAPHLTSRNRATHFSTPAPYQRRSLAQWPRLRPHLGHRTAENSLRPGPLAEIRRETKSSSSISKAHPAAACKPSTTPSSTAAKSSESCRKLAVPFDLFTQHSSGVAQRQRNPRHAVVRNRRSPSSRCHPERSA